MIRSSFRRAQRRSGDNQRAVVQFLDTGHFALETHAREIADSIRDFLK
jgi:pimeloyl-ACP methyl ester carboxylesterase